MGKKLIVQSKDDRMFFGKIYHWTHNRKGNRVLHQGPRFKPCRRVHMNSKGYREQ